MSSRDRRGYVDSCGRCRRNTETSRRSSCPPCHPNCRFAFRVGALNSSGSQGHIVAFQISGSNQCDLRFNALGNLFFTRKGTNLGAGAPTLSTNTLAINTRYHIEFKAIFGLSSNGTCEVKVNGVRWVTLTSVTNATTVATADSVNLLMGNGTGNFPEPQWFTE